MVDFKKLVKKIEQERGYCSLKEEDYATITAWRGRDMDSLRRTWCSWIVESDSDGFPIFKILDDVTGYESFYVHHLLKDGPMRSRVGMCAGSDLWDVLLVDGGELREILEAVL